MHRNTWIALTLSAVLATGWAATGTALGREATEGFFGAVRARTYTV